MKFSIDTGPDKAEKATMLFLATDCRMHRLPVTYATVTFSREEAALLAEENERLLRIFLAGDPADDYRHYNPTIRFHRTDESCWTPRTTTFLDETVCQYGTQDMALIIDPNEIEFPSFDGATDPYIYADADPKIGGSGFGLFADAEGSDGLMTEAGSLLTMHHVLHHLTSDQNARLEIVDFVGRHDPFQFLTMLRAGDWAIGSDPSKRRPLHVRKSTLARLLAAGDDAWPLWNMGRRFRDSIVSAVIQRMGDLVACDG